MNNRKAAEWLLSLLEAGVSIVVPEICDYELRRELIRTHKTESLNRLDKFEEQVHYEPLTTEAMRLAARYWADARNRGQPTAPPLALDADVILAAQAILLTDDESQVVVATTNVGHLSRFVAAEEWSSVRPDQHQSPGRPNTDS